MIPKPLANVLWNRLSLSWNATPNSRVNEELQIEFKKPTRPICDAISIQEAVNAPDIQKHRSPEQREQFQRGRWCSDPSKIKKDTIHLEIMELMKKCTQKNYYLVSLIGGMKMQAPQHFSGIFNSVLKCISPSAKSLRFWSRPRIRSQRSGS